jgi:phosphoribosylformylglycinamidine synthase
MAMAGQVGAVLDLPVDTAVLFGEDQARYILATATPETVETRAEAAGVPVSRIGTTGGDVLSLAGESVSVAALKTAHEGWLPAYMAGKD